MKEWTFNSKGARLLREVSKRQMPLDKLFPTKCKTCGAYFDRPLFFIGDHPACQKCFDEVCNED